VFEKFVNRMKFQGIFSAVNYFVFTVGVEKIGVEIIKRFLFSGPVMVTFDDKNIKIYDEIIDIPSTYINDLIHECGERFSQSVENKLGKGEKLAIGIVDGSAASIAWMKKENKKNNLLKGETWLIHGCLTIPRFRGQKLYPRSILGLTDLAFKLSRPDVKTNILIESSIANKASISGITQCGFKYFGYVINFKDKVLFSS